MERMNSYLGKHLWLQLLLSLLAACVVVPLLYPERSLVEALPRIGGAALTGVAVLLAVRRKEKRATGGSVDDLVSLDRMLRRGEVPDQPHAREAMRELVDHRLHRTRHRVAAQVGLAVMWSAIVVLMALTTGLRQTLGMSVFAAAFLTWLVLYGNLQHRRLRTMREELRARD
ncbi:hypothetical protein AB0I06_16945 [Streptomyces sp. NPDC050674]|uniref:hypothetical protein n=1 Tax=Streptomyces sp. NPDC050674 TaxID=3157216 RepID=UPI00342D7B72